MEPKQGLEARRLLSIAGDFSLCDLIQIRMNRRRLQGVGFCQACGMAKLLLAEPDQIVPDLNLSIGVRPRADPNHGKAGLLRNLFGEITRNEFKDESGRARCFKLAGLLQKFRGGLGVFRSAGRFGVVLREVTEVRPNLKTICAQFTNSVGVKTFKLYSVSSIRSKLAGGGAHRGGALAGAVGEVYQQVGLLNATVDGLYEYAQFIDRKFVLMTVPQDIGGGGIPYKDDVEARGILNAGAGVVVAGQGRNRRADGFEGDEIREAFAGAS